MKIQRCVCIRPRVRVGCGDCEKWIDGGMTITIIIGAIERVLCKQLPSRNTH